MAEALKNHFGPSIPERMGQAIRKAYPAFDLEGFLSLSLDGFEDLELMARARHITDALAAALPPDRERALEIVLSSLGLEDEEERLTGMDGFFFLPFVFFVAEHGLDHFEASMLAQYELTKRFTAEFSLRAFIQRYPEETFQRLRLWATDANVHVRRLVSEGTRSRLPWAPRLKRVQDDPSEVVDLLELLKDDGEEYVRRSVANNLNDISKDHPVLAVDVARRWWQGGSHHRRRLVRHGLRTLIKKGDPDALSIMGYRGDSPATVSRVTCEPASLRIGGRVRLEVQVSNPSEAETGALVDLRVHFVKADGSTSPKVFKGSELQLGPGGQGRVRKTLSVAQLSTRKHYPGAHRVDVVLNGIVHPGTEFQLL